MKHKRFLFAAAALSLGLAAIPAFAQSPGGDMPKGSAASKAECDALMGAAKEACLKGQITPSTPGRSEDAASRQGGRTPGRSEDAASRTGTPPGQPDQEPAAGGSPKD